MGVKGTEDFEKLKPLLLMEPMERNLSPGCALKGGLERLNLSNPDFVENPHREYIASGSCFIETNTFQANRINLMRFGAEKDFKEIIAAGVLLAKKAAYNNDNIYIAGSLGPIPSQEGEPVPLSEQETLFQEQIEILCSNGVDVRGWSACCY